MRVGTVATAAAASFIAIGLGSADAERATGACAARHSHTVVANARVRVYRKAGVYYACAYKTGRRVKLPSNEPGVDGYGPFAVAGPHVAFGYYPSCGVCEDEDNFAGEIQVVKRKTRLWRLDDEDDGKVTRVKDIAVDGGGAAAWISRDRRHRADVRVETAEPGSDQVTLLDSGPGISLHSLARSGRTLYWTKDGTPRSARLGR